MKRVLMTTAGELSDALEGYVRDVENPSTPEQWERFFAWMEERGGARQVGQVPDSTTAGYIAGSLRDEGINARVLRPKKEGEDGK